MSENSGVPDGTGLGALEETYDIVGELRGAGDLRTYLARRRTSNVEVMITVVPGGANDNNAMGLFAADVNLLSGVSHPGVLQTIEGRWLADGAFATVTERARGGTVGELLAKGQLENPQVATLLRDVNGSLQWARGVGVVHRGVDVDAMFLEPGSNRLEIALLPTAIGAAGIPGEATDARSIGRLAWTLLARQDPESDPLETPLATLRPDLPEQVITEVERMRSATRDAMPDVDAFIAVIATADVIKQAETAIAARQAEVAESERTKKVVVDTEREQWRRRALAAEWRLSGKRASRNLRPSQIAMPLIVIAVIATGAVFWAHHQSQGRTTSTAAGSVVPDAMTSAPTSAAPTGPSGATIVAPDPALMGSAAVPPPLVEPPMSAVRPPTTDTMSRPVSPSSTPEPVPSARTAPAPIPPNSPLLPSTAPTVPRVFEPRRVPVDSPRPDSVRSIDTLRARVAEPVRERPRPCENRDTTKLRDTTSRPDTIPGTDSVRPRIRRFVLPKCDSTTGPP